MKIREIRTRKTKKPKCIKIHDNLESGKKAVNSHMRNENKYYPRSSMHSHLEDEEGNILYGHPFDDDCYECYKKGELKSGVPGYDYEH